MASSETTATDLPPTMGPDAVGYDDYERVFVDRALMIYLDDEDEAWIRSTSYVSLDTQQ